MRERETCILWHIPTIKPVTQSMSIHNFEAYGCFWGSCVNYQGQLQVAARLRTRVVACFWSRRRCVVSTCCRARQLLLWRHSAPQDAKDTSEWNRRVLGGLSKIFNLAILGVLPSNCLITKNGSWCGWMSTEFRHLRPWWAATWREHVQETSNRGKQNQWLLVVISWSLKPMRESVLMTAYYSDTTLLHRRHTRYKQVMQPMSWPKIIQ